ncbi:MAG: hypothetical protein FJ088_03025 [Deltaproteobacteria bacterium]|nr:hypothetical protein [Deltaproteobacteria bacterium]
MAVLEGMPAVHKKVIVNQFVSQDGVLESFNIDSLLSDKGAAKNDNFEFMGQVNPTAKNFDFKVEPFLFSDRIKQNLPEFGNLAFVDEMPVESLVPGHYVDISLPLGMEDVVSAASYHQKFIVVDGTAAFVSGMNLRTVDWDTSEHLVYDPRRMDFSSSIAEKEDVLSKASLPDNGPRKDMTVYIEGPAVEDVSAVFKKRWDYLLGQGVKYSENSTSLTVKKNLPEFSAGVEAQITVTMPEPFDAHGIVETWYGAIRNAKKYIYIENQYLRAPMLNDLIVERMKEEPGLVLIVVTKPVSEWVDPSCWWTYKTDQLFKEEFPERYFVYQLRSFDFVDVGWGFDETESRFTDMDTHTKCQIADDIFISVGSANHNNRGLIYEGEMNVAVLDGWFAREARKRVFGNILKEFYTDSDNVSGIVDDFKKAAAWNQFVWDNWEAEGWDIDLDGASLPIEYYPFGFLYPLDLGNPDDCLFEGISPDLMSPVGF